MTQTNCGKRCSVTISGPVAHSVTEAIRSRFDGVTTRTGDTTAVVVEAVDQAAVRAVLIMLWDSGHEVVAMVLTPGGPAG